MTTHVSDTTMTKTSLRQFLPVLESMEQRVSLSAAQLIASGVGLAHVHSLSMRKISHSPVIARLSPVEPGIEISSVTFNARAKVLQIKGTVIGQAALPPYSPYIPYYTGPASVSISVSAKQAISRQKSVSGSASSEGLASIAGQKIPFTVRMVADSGYFTRGYAEISISTYTRATSTPDYYYYYYPQLSSSVVVRIS